MWEDFEVGSTGGLNAATTVAAYSDLSENSAAYWWHDQDLDLGGKIAKDTPEGKGITLLLEKKAREVTIYHRLFEIAVTKMSARKIVTIITKARAKSFEAGQACKVAEIREALGV